MRAQRSNESPSGAFKRPNGLAQQDGGALPRQVLRLLGRMRPPRLCCGIKHTKSEILPPYAPQISCFDSLSLFSPGAYLPFPGGCGAETRPSGREKKQDAPQEDAYNSAMRPVKSAQEGTFVWFGARGARKFKFSHFFGLLLRVRSGRPLHICQPTRVQLSRSCTGSGEVQRRHAYDECPQKFRQTDP